MEEVKLTMLKTLKYLGVVLGIVFIWWYVKNSNIEDILKYQTIGWNFLFIIFVSFSAQMFATYAWKLSFSEPPKNISIFKLFLIRLVGESFAVINPTNVVAGESLKALMLKKEDVEYKNSIASLTFSRYLMIFSVIFLLTITFSFSLSQILSKGTGYIAVAFIILMSVILILTSYFIISGRGILGVPFYLLHTLFPNKRWFKKTFIKLKRIDRELLEIITQSKSKVLLAFILSAFHWLMGGLEFYLILTFLGVDITLFQALIVEMGIILFKNMGAFIPGQIGVEEFGNKIMLNFINITGNDIWIGASILRRGRQLFWLACGVIIFTIFMKEKKQLVEEGV